MHNKKRTEEVLIIIIVIILGLLAGFNIQSILEFITWSINLFLKAIRDN